MLQTGPAQMFPMSNHKCWKQTICGPQMQRFNYIVNVINLWVIKEDHKLATLHFLNLIFILPQHWSSTGILQGLFVGLFDWTITGKSWIYMKICISNSSESFWFDVYRVFDSSEAISGLMMVASGLSNFIHVPLWVCWAMSNDCLTEMSGHTGNEFNQSSTAAHKSMLKPLSFWHLENQTFNHLQV